MCRRLFFFLVVVLVAVAVCAVLYVRHAAEPTHPFLNPKSISPQAAHAAQNRLEQALAHPETEPHAPPSAQPAAQTKAAVPGQPVTVHFSQDDINTTLAANQQVRQQMAAHGVQAAQVSFSPPNMMTADIKVIYHGEPAIARVTGVVAPGPDGALGFTAQSATVGGVPVPPATVQKAVDRLTQEFLPKAASSLPLSVRQVSVKGKDIYLTGPAKNPPPAH